MRRTIAIVAVVAAIGAAAACGFDAIGGIGTTGAGVQDSGSEVGSSLPVGPGDPDAGMEDAPSDGDPADQLVADASIVPACPMGQLLCGATCVTANDCTSCNSGKFHCKTLRTCAASCASCRELSGAPLPIECVACDLGQNNPIASCEANAATTFCLSGNYATAYKGAAGLACNCNNATVSNCPAATQTCVSVSGEDYCFTCGQAGTTGKPCKNGKSCNASLSPPACP